jgi:hypothetical protein
MGGSIHDGYFITHTYSTLQLSSIADTLSTVKQYFSEQPFYRNFAIPRVSQETPPTGLSQAGFSKTALSSSQQSSYYGNQLQLVYIVDQ